MSSKSEVFEFFGGGAEGTLLGGVIWDLRCPFLNLDELFPSKVRLVENFKSYHLNFLGGTNPLLGGYK